MTYKSPPIQRPTYIGIAGAEDASNVLSDTISGTTETIIEKVSPLGGMIFGGVVAASAFYFMPKFWDWVLKERSDGFSGNFHGLSDTDFEPVELDVEE